MIYFVIKCALSGIIIAVISEVAKRSPAFGALIASLPLLSVLGMLWLWRDTGDAERIASQAEATFWYVLPSLPMFLVLPTMLRAGAGFWPSMGAGCVLTIVLYFRHRMGSRKIWDQSLRTETAGEPWSCF
jgi:hypothetical protein